MPRSKPVVAIDGPAGSGKTTVARAVAEALAYSLVDTGALYRCLALLARRAGVADGDGLRLSDLAHRMRIRFVPDVAMQRVLLNDEDVTEAIREPEISQGASCVSVHAGVRRALLGIQRELGRDGGVVIEGRDIGTVVFPDAEVKVFLQANPEVRSQRRFAELRGKGKEVSLGETHAELLERDSRDAGREVAPLKPAADAVIIDTGPLTVAEVIEEILTLTSRVIEKLQALETAAT